MKSNKPKLWTKDFITISSANLFIFLTFYLLMVTLTVYTVDQFHTSQSLAGLASSIFVLGAVLIRPIAGKTIDSLGRKKMLLISLILFLIASVLYFQVNSLPMLFVNRLIHGLAFGVASTATGSISAAIIPNERRGEGTGYFAMSMNIAMAIGPFIGLFITQHYSFDLIFVTATIFSIAALVATLFVRVPKGELKPQQIEAKTSMKLSDFFEKKALPAAMLIGIIGFTYSSVLSFLTSYAQEINLVSAASYFFLTYAIFLIASRPFTGRWFDKYGDNMIIYPSLLLFAGGMLLLSQAYFGIILLIAGGLIGIGFGTFQSSTQAIAVKQSPHHRMSLATSTYFTFLDLGIGIGPFVLGFTIPLLGYRGLYVAMTILTIICMGVYYFIHGKHASEKQKNQVQLEQKLNA